MIVFTSPSCPGCRSQVSRMRATGGVKTPFQKLRLGNLQPRTKGLFLPISVEVHHALMDGLHVGRYLSRMEDMLNEPGVYVPNSAARD